MPENQKHKLDTEGKNLTASNSTRLTLPPHSVSSNVYTRKNYKIDRRKIDCKQFTLRAPDEEEKDS